jgi:sugar phosphate isomerase/epimerase
MSVAAELKTLQISGFSDEIDASFDRQLQVTRELGMSAVCLRAADGRGIFEYSVEDARTSLLPRLEQAGVVVSALGSPFGKVSITDPEAVSRQLLQLNDVCEVANLLGAPRIRMFSYYMPSPETADAFAGQVIDHLGKAEAIARRHGVMLVHENEKHTFGDVGRRCQQVLDAIDSPFLQAAFDFANFVQCGDDPVACWELLNSRVGDIHIKDARTGDNRNVLCGTGDGNIAHILNRAIAGGYRGALTLEPHLAHFDTFKKLERGADFSSDASHYESGAAAYAAQLNALLGILDTIDGAIHDVHRSAQ